MKFEILAIAIDVILICNAILFGAGVKRTKDVQIKTIFLTSSVMFILLEAVKILIEIFTAKSFIMSAIVITIYTILIVLTMYSINKEISSQNLVRTKELR